MEIMIQNNLYLTEKIEYYKDMKQKKSLTQTKAVCRVLCESTHLYVAQMLVGAIFIAALIFPIF